MIAATSRNSAIVPTLCVLCSDIRVDGPFSLDLLYSEPNWFETAALGGALPLDLEEIVARRHIKQVVIIGHMQVPSGMRCGAVDAYAKLHENQPLELPGSLTDWVEQFVLAEDPYRNLLHNCDLARKRLKDKVVIVGVLMEHVTQKWHVQYFSVPGQKPQRFSQDLWDAARNNQFLWIPSLNGIRLPESVQTLVSMNDCRAQEAERYARMMHYGDGQSFRLVVLTSHPRHPFHYKAVRERLGVMTRHPRPDAVFSIYVPSDVDHGAVQAIYPVMHWIDEQHPIDGQLAIVGHSSQEIDNILHALRQHEVFNAWSAKMDRKHIITVKVSAR